MSDRRRRPGLPLPLQKARRIHADNQARGQRARTHLEKARRKRSDAIRKDVRSSRRSPASLQAESGRRRMAGAMLFALSVGVGAGIGLPALDAAGQLGATEATRIDVISVHGNQLLSSRDVAAATGVLPGQVGGEVEPTTVGERLREHPWIRDAQVMRLPTGTLLVSIDEREPVALLAPVEADEAWRFVDGTGTPFARQDATSPALLDAETAGWPRLRGGERLADGQAHPELAAALALARHLHDVRLAVLLGSESPLEVRLPQPGDPQGWVLDSGPGRPRVILGHDQLIERLGRLEALLRSELEELRGASQIDLRFADRAVLRSTTASS